MKRLCDAISTEHDDSGFGLTKEQKEASRKQREENQAKRARIEEKKVENQPPGAKLLALSGYSGTGGLGKHEQGVVEPLQSRGRLVETTVDSRAGLGSQTVVEFKTHAFEAPDESIELAVQWFAECPATSRQQIDWAALLKWHQGKPFTFPAAALELSTAKSALDKLTDKALRLARDRANPYERVGNGQLFINRAALKLAEIDCALDFQLIGRATCDVLDVADLCGGPGGFSEYVLYRRKWQARVFGLTLAGGREDWQTRRFRADAPTLAFQPIYGPPASHARTGSGDILDQNVRVDFIRTVLKATRGTGLHLVVADGGFSVESRESMQEELSARLICCQLMVALAVLRRGGSLVLKLFDCFLPVTQDIISIAWHTFERVALVKPVQSRPANSERYLLCTGYTGQSKALCVALNACCSAMANHPTDKATDFRLASEALQAAPFPPGTLDVKQQIDALRRLMTYVEDPALRSNDQDAIRDACLKKWRLGESPAEDVAAQLTDPLFGRRLFSYDQPVIQMTDLGMQVTRRAAQNLKSLAVVPSDAKQLAVWRLEMSGQRAVFVRDRSNTVVLGAQGDVTPNWIHGAALPDTVLDVWLPSSGQSLVVLDAHYIPSSTADASSVTNKSIADRSSTIASYLLVLADKRLQYRQPTLVDAASVKAEQSSHVIWRNAADGKWGELKPIA